MKVYAAYYENTIRQLSSSGGIFSLLASKYDVVYGVQMTSDCYGCEFVRIEGDVSRLRGSKYMQAKMGDTYKNVKTDLEKKKKVLFIGTGCQVNGLVFFLQKDYGNLLLVDVVCHGVPSPKLWKMYLLNQENNCGKIKSVNFRCKDKGWKNYGIIENDLYFSKDSDTFMQMFLRNYSLRPSCYECHAKTQKKSDLTIGDFWGIEHVAAELDDGLGTSLVITRTEKAEQMFQSIQNELHWKEVDYNQAVKHNSAEYSSPVRPKERNRFYKDANHMPYKKLSRKYLGKSVFLKFGHKVKNYIYYKLRRINS